MKKSTNSLFTTLSNIQLESLTNQVQETLALACNLNNNKVFTNADLWNIHSKAKNQVQRRFL